MNVTLLTLCLVMGQAADGGSGKNSQTIVEIAEGAGKTHEEALTDAFRRAIQQVVGVYVISARTLEKGGVIDRKVLTHSRGFIESYKELTLPKDRELHRVRIVAKVRIARLIAELKTNDVEIKSFDGAGAFAKAVTTIERKKKVRALLEESLKYHPYGCFQCTILGEPDIKERGDNAVVCRFKVKYTIDMDRYTKSMEWLADALSQIAVESVEFSVPIVTKANGKREFAKDYRLAAHPTIQNLAVFKTAFLDGPTGRKGIAISLCTKFDPARGRSDWKFFFFDIPDWEHASWSVIQQSGGEFHLACLDKNRGTVLERAFHFPTWTPGYPRLARVGSSMMSSGPGRQTIFSYPNEFFIAPILGDPSNFFEDELIQYHEAQIPLNQLRMIDSFQGSVRFQPISFPRF